VTSGFGFLIYLGLLWLLGGITAMDIEVVKNLTKKKGILSHE
jgi:hypothetical protein